MNATVAVWLPGVRFEANALTVTRVCPGAAICPEVWSSWSHGAAFWSQLAVQFTMPVPPVHNETWAEIGWFDPCMAGPSERVDGLTQLKLASVGVRDVVGDGDEVCVGVGPALPVVGEVGVVPGL